MRPVSFLALLRILLLVSHHPGGLRAGELDNAILTGELLATKKGSSPARTTLYHHRNTLEHLGALKRHNRFLKANTEDPNVRVLLECQYPTDTQLDATPRDAFSELVLSNEDCREQFFDLFMPSSVGSYSVSYFRASGHPIVWHREYEMDQGSEVLLQAEGTDRRVTLRSSSEIKGILYGLRYWARDELKLVDESFRENRSSVIYPIFSPENAPSPQQVLDEIFALLDSQHDWTILSIRDLIVQCCERRRRPLQVLFAALRLLETKYAKRTVFIPTSRSFATLTARSLAREEFELRGYYRDNKGRYISHIRIHESVRRSCNVQDS